MAELPKIVKSRLAQQGSADHAAHPDANLLAAFAEQTLLERERAAVSAHLAQCADCRESLALAAAQEPVVLPVGHRVAGSTKRHWLLEWRWVGAAAVASCVIAVALQYRVQPPLLEKTNYSVAPPSGVAQTPQEQLAQQIAAAAKLKVEHLKKAPQLPPPPAPAQEQSPPVVMTQLEARMPEKNPAVVTVRPAEPPGPSEQANSLLPSAIERKAFQPSPAETARAQNDIAEIKAKAGLRPGASGFAKGLSAAAPLAVARAVSRVSEPIVLWSIDASPATAGNARGVVERSMDSGKTWEVAPLRDDVSFRAVVSAGPHVWAGGTNGALFHSPDGGASWEQITVAGEGAKLTGTIVNIDARDTNLIKITTTSGEKWISLDGGRQWRRQ